jgi:hypothetical protein
MKLINYVSLLILSSMLFAACEKDRIKYSPLASLKVTTAVIDGDEVKMNTNTTDIVSAYNSRGFGMNAGNAEVLLYPSSSPTTPYFKAPVPSADGEIFSIFLCGQTPNFEYVLKKESLENYADSVIGVRVINLSPNSTPVNISLESNPGVNVFSGVAYKQLTEFVKFPLKKIVPAGSISFQLRSAADPAVVLATYTLPDEVDYTYPGISIPQQRFKNITIVVKGLHGTTDGANAFGMFPVAASF